MIITIGGPIGSGTTTVAQAIAEKLDIKHIYAGDIFRQMAEEKGMSLAEFSELAEADADIDRHIDARQIEEAKKGNCIVEGRLSGWLVDADLAIWLTAPLTVRVNRVCGREEKDFERAKIETTQREASEKKRYKDIYDIDIMDLSRYDLVLNTEHWDAGEVSNIMLGAIENKGD